MGGGLACLLAETSEVASRKPSRTESDTRIWLQKLLNNFASTACPWKLRGRGKVPSLMEAEGKSKVQR